MQSEKFPFENFWDFPKMVHELGPESSALRICKPPDMIQKESYQRRKAELLRQSFCCIFALELL